jgi:hypothetical protein
MFLVYSMQITRGILLLEVTSFQRFQTGVVLRLGVLGMQITQRSSRRVESGLWRSKGDMYFRGVLRRDWGTGWMLGR